MLETIQNIRIANSRLVILVTLVVVVLLGSGWYFGWFGETTQQARAGFTPPPAVVAVDQARLMTMAPHTVLPGTVVSLRDAVIAAEIAGKVLEVAQVGATVNKGDSLAEIDPRDAQQRVAQRRAELQRLQSLLQYHSDYYQRVGLQKSKTLGVPEVVIAELKSNRDTAKADVASATAALKSAQNDLERTSIRAPFPGRVVSQSIQVGEYAQAGAAIVRLVDTQNLEVSARVPAALVQPIEPGTPLIVSGMGKTLSAPMRALVPVGDAVSRTMELRVELKDSGLLVGSPVRVSLPSAAPRQVVAIPRDAVVLRSDAEYVFVIDNEGNAHRHNVELGYAEGDMIEVIGDIAPLATVVVRGGERLRDGQAVTWKSADDGNAEALSSSQ